MTEILTWTVVETQCPLPFREILTWTVVETQGPPPLERHPDLDWDPPRESFQYAPENYSGIPLLQSPDVYPEPLYHNSQILVVRGMERLPHLDMMRALTKYGRVVDLERRYHRADYGFVVYASPDSVNRALADGPIMTVAGRQLCVERRSPSWLRKVAVGNLPPGLTGDQVVAVFSRFGRVVGRYVEEGGAVVMYDSPGEAAAVLARGAVTGCHTLQAQAVDRYMVAQI